jgi:uncharacterized protein with HEPN domain
VPGDLSLESLEADWQRHWLIERGIEIITEASRHLPQAMKNRHPDIPWTKAAGIGNVLRHGYEGVAAFILWKLVREDLPALVQACREDLTAGQRRDDQGRRNATTDEHG